MKSFTLLFFAALLCCRLGADQWPNRPFTIVVYTSGVAEGTVQSIEGERKQVVMEVIEVKRGEFDLKRIYFPFRVTDEPPLKIGVKYVIRGAWGRHGLIYYEWKEVEERQPNQALQTTSVTRSGFGKVSVGALKDEFECPS